MGNILRVVVVAVRIKKKLTDLSLRPEKTDPSTGLFMSPEKFVKHKKKKDGLFLHRLSIFYSFYYQRNRLILGRLRVENERRKMS